MTHQQIPNPNAPAGADPVAQSERIARKLAGDLACIRCGYNLRSLSVRSACPECGTSVLATVLDAVDPAAGVIAPIRRRRLVAIGLVLWPAAAIVAALLMWFNRFWIETVAMMEVGRLPPLWLGPATLAAIALSALGSIALIAPHAGIPRRHRLMAAGGTALMAALVGLRLLDAEAQSLSPASFLKGTTLDPGLLTLRVIGATTVVAIVFLFRPNAKLLAQRSQVLRSGGAERQSMIPLGGAMALILLGALLGLIGVAAGDLVLDTVFYADMILTGLGAVLFTIGLWGVFRDCLRIAPVILQPRLEPSKMLVDESVPERSASEGRPAPKGAGGLGQ